MLAPCVITWFLVFWFFFFFFKKSSIAHTLPLVTDRARRRPDSQPAENAECQTDPPRLSRNHQFVSWPKMWRSARGLGQTLWRVRVPPKQMLASWAERRRARVSRQTFVLMNAKAVRAGCTPCWPYVATQINRSGDWNRSWGREDGTNERKLERNE